MNLAILIASIIAAVGGAVGGVYAVRAFLLATESRDFEWVAVAVSRGVYDISTIGTTEARDVRVELWTDTEAVEARRDRFSREDEPIRLTLPRRAAGEGHRETLPAWAGEHAEEMREFLEQGQVQLHITWKTRRGARLSDHQDVS